MNAPMSKTSIWIAVVSTRFSSVSSTASPASTISSSFCSVKWTPRSSSTTWAFVTA